MRSVPPRGSGLGSGKELRLIEHDCNGPTRSRAVVLTSWATSSAIQRGKLHQYASADTPFVEPGIGISSLSIYIKRPRALRWHIFAEFHLGSLKVLATPSPLLPNTVGSPRARHRLARVEELALNHPRNPSIP